MHITDPAPPLELGWTESRVARLREMWTAGSTAGQIAAAIGVSRNAVIGKARRLELESRPSPIRGES